MDLLSGRKPIRSEGFAVSRVSSLSGISENRTQSDVCFRCVETEAGKTKGFEMKISIDVVFKKPDYAAIRAAKLKAKRKAMFGQVAYIRKSAIRSFGSKTKKISSPNEVPRIHSSQKFSVKNIRFWVSGDASYGLVGAVKLDKQRKDAIASRPAGSILERGGKVKFVEGLYRLPSGKKTWRRLSKKQEGKLWRQRSKRVSIAKRPFMVPALMKSIQSGAIMLPWKNSFGS